MRGEIVETDAGATTTDAVRRRFSARPPATARIRGDHDLNPDFPARAATREAAVLVPLIDRPGGPTVLLNLRAPDLADHAGQIGFPGGRREARDRTEEDNALREAWEEVGLAPEDAEILGRLDVYLSRTGFRITPVVAIVRPFRPRLQAEEVAEAFEVPLSLFLDPDADEIRSVEVEGRVRRFHAFEVGNGRTVWGVTAGILVNLRDALS